MGSKGAEAFPTALTMSRTSAAEIPFVLQSFSRCSKGRSSLLQIVFLDMSDGATAFRILSDTWTWFRANSSLSDGLYCTKESRSGFWQLGSAAQVVSVALAECSPQHL